MAINRKNNNVGYGLSNGLQDLSPLPIITVRDPLASDKAELGCLWVNTSTNGTFQLTSFSGGGSVWTGLGSTGGPFTSLTIDPGDLTVTSGDIIVSAGDLTLTAGNASIGGNLDVVGTTTVADIVITGDFDLVDTAQITIESSAAQADAIKLNASDAAGGIEFDYGTGGMAINGANGAFVVATGTGAVTLSGDVAATTVHLGTGAAAKTVVLGSTDTTSTTTINSGSGNVNLTTAGDIIATSTHNAGSAIYLHANGGTSETIKIHADQGTGAASIDILSDAGGVSLKSSLIGAASIFINAAGNAASGLDVNVGTGGGTIDSTGVLSLDSAGASNFTVTGAFDLSLISTAGSVVINGGEAAVDAVTIAATDAAGGLDINLGTGGATLDTTAGFSWDAATASNVTVTGSSEDLTLSSVGGSVIVSATEDAANAIYVHANGGTSETIKIHADQGTGAASINVLSDVGGITIQSGLAGAASVFVNAAGNAASGLDVNVGTGGGTIDSTGVLSLDSAAASNFTVTGAFDLTLSSTAGSTIVSGGEAVIDAVQLTAGNAGGGVRVTSGTLGATTGLNLVQGAVNASIQVGAGDPAHAAPKGTLYIKTDASTAVTRLWVNTDAGTTWAFFTASA